jgi:hypothetical protein
MANTFRLKRSAVQGKAPAVGDLQLGELALNTYDGRLYTLKNDGVAAVVQIGATAITPNSVTFNNSGTGGASGSTFNGTSALTVSSNTIGALSNSTTSTQNGYFGDIFLYDDSTPSHYLQITNSADLTAARLLSINVNDANRVVSLSGDLTLANNFTTAGNFALTLTTTAATSVTLPMSGTLAVNNQTMHIGTTALAINRASAAQTLTGVSIDGSAATLTTTRTLWGQNFNGEANVSGNLTAVGNITGTGAVTLTATNGTLSLVATGANAASITTNGVNRVQVTSAGDVGVGTTSPGFKLEVAGSFAATTKSFVIPHPTKKGHRLRYACLEGPENSVYVRGRSTEFVIELPEYWAKLVDADSITVSLTPIGKTQVLWIKDIRDNKVYVGSKCASVEYFYMVLAERADVDKLEVEVEVVK